uniref:chorismate mutase n=2 Tax=Heterodera glycines TaxID=51029 RepID=Q29YA9_HETGL|nr:chorismate mutase 1A [Heterodera glycines]
MNSSVVSFSLLLFGLFTIRTAKSQCEKHCTKSKPMGQCNEAEEVILRNSDCAFMKKTETAFEFVVGMNGQTEDKTAPGANANGAFLCCKATQGTATLFIVGVANKRLMLAKDVVNYKFHNNISIDDFVREKQVLESVSAQGQKAGIGDNYGEKFFQDQMDANKMIQKGYVKLWTANKSLLPQNVPDLQKDTRPKVTAATEEMILALKVFQQFRINKNCWASVEKELLKSQSFLSLAEPNGKDAMRKAAVRLCAEMEAKIEAQIDETAKKLLA